MLAIQKLPSYYWVFLCLALLGMPESITAQKKQTNSDFPETLFSEEELKAMGKTEKQKTVRKPYLYDSARFERNKINTYYLYESQATNSAYTGIGSKLNVLYGFDAVYPTNDLLYKNTHRVLSDIVIGKKKRHGLGLLYERENYPYSNSYIFNRKLLQLSKSRIIKLYKSHTLRIGFALGYEQIRMGGMRTNLTFGDMIDPRYGFIYETQEQRFGPTRSYPTINAGFTYSNNFMQFSASSTYITQPRNGFISSQMIPLRMHYALSGYLPFAQKNLLNAYLSLQTSGRTRANGLGEHIYFFKAGINMFFLKYAYLGIAATNLQYVNFSAGFTAFDRLRIGIDNDVFWTPENQTRFAAIRSINVHIRYVSKK